MDTYAVIDKDLKSVAEAAGATFNFSTQYLCDKQLCHSITPDRSEVCINSVHLNPKYLRSHLFYLDDVFAQ
jgi:hypothetical protein